MHCKRKRDRKHTELYREERSLDVLMLQACACACGIVSCFVSVQFVFTAYLE
jgi:hypothetical protein